MLFHVSCFFSCFLFHDSCFMLLVSSFRARAGQAGGPCFSGEGVLAKFRGRVGASWAAFGPIFLIFWGTSQPSKNMIFDMCQNRRRRASQSTLGIPRLDFESFWVTFEGNFWLYFSICLKKLKPLKSTTVPHFDALLPFQHLTFSIKLPFIF